MSTSAGGVSNRAARQTYHPGGSGVSEGLARARKPFRTTNAFTGAVIAGFALSVYLYSIRAVAQDDFSDVPAPTEAQRTGVKSIEDEQKERELLKQQRKLGLAELSTDTQARAAEAQQASRALDRMGGQLDSPVGLSTGPGIATSTSPLDHRTATSSGMSLWERLIGSFGGQGTDSAFVQGAPPVDKIGRVGDKAGVPVAQVDAQAQAATRRLV